MKSATDIFTELGERLAAFGKDARSCSIIAAAAAGNEWFSAEDICRAVDALRRDMLQHDELQAWLSSYECERVVPRRVAIIMAGNIPLVGFFDLLCVVACGHVAVVKPSGKDSVLIRYVIEELRSIEPEIRVEVVENITENAASADAVIAMGGDNTKRHLRSIFAGKPQLLRGNRHSAAVLSGKESRAELDALCDDIFSYSGLGCRNVSMLFVPRGYRPTLKAKSLSPKYINNYRQSRALLTMQGSRFVDSGCCLLTAGSEFPTAISCITVCEYDSLSEVYAWLATHDGELQCVVSTCVEHSRRVGFGEAQHPTLYDYPDEADVMKFLTEI